MKEKKKQKEGVGRRKLLRKRAEETLRSRPSHRKTAKNADLRRLVHELEIHQIELKLQNEALRHAQVELAASRDRYTDLYEFAPLAYVTLDKNGRVIQSNWMAAEMFGVEQRDLIRASLTKFVVPESQDDWYLHYHGALSGEPRQVCEIRIRKADRTLRSMRAESTAVWDGENRRCLTAFIDITERKRAEEEREQLLAREQAARLEAETATRAKDRFLAMVSHELRTPLTPILGWVGMLREKRVKDDNIDSALECIERNAKMQAKLVGDLLDVTGSLRGKMSLSLQPVELSEIVNAAVDTVRPAADAKHINIRTQLGNDARMASGDPDRLQQVIWNLLTNAIKFTPGGGKIEVQLVRVAASVQVIVSDTGEGISADFLPHIFDPFSQAEDTRMRSQGGLGLGLAIVHHIVELHGGTIRVRSTEGRGTTFTIRLPWEDERQPAITVVEPRIEGI
jgi:PAS domain S-box-containing protein